MKDFVKTFALFGAKGESLGEVRGILSHRSSEENREDDLSRSVETALVVIPPRFCPPFPLSRGMTLSPRGEGGVYRVLTPVRVGRLWRLKTERIHTEDTP